LLIDLDLEGGGTLDIPYSQFANTTIIRSSPMSGVLSHRFKLAMYKPLNLLQEKEKISSLLLSIPWVLPNQKISFEYGTEDDKSYVINVLVLGIDKEQLQRVGSRVKMHYAGRAADSSPNIK